MDSISSLHPLAKTWLLDGPLLPYVDAFVALMERGGYAEGTVTTDLRALAHFAHWMTRCQLAADQIEESLVEQFLDSHLPRCDCHASALRTHNDLRTSLGHESPTTTHQYIEVDLAMKERAHSRLQDPGVVTRRLRADDSLLDFLKTL